MSQSQWIVALLAPLAIWILLSGLDDVFIVIVWLLPRRRFRWPSEPELQGAAERRIAVFVPLWNEHRVVGRMLERNLASIRYECYDIFAGVYPNDEATIRAVAEMTCRDRRVHIAMLPHDGPTSKGDCLNWIWRRMQEYETAHGVRFEIILTHDAEDLVHPESLRLVNWFSRENEMVQVPVLALPTSWHQLTHGIYCDEFAEYQQKDIPVRQHLGGFLPSNGVGTGFGREALEALAAARDRLPFDPRCLTEDYENGYRLNELGYRQVFVPLRRSGVPVATREYFPCDIRSAVRQRSRWVAGITLQGWQHHGWRAPRRQIYWLWRDRKGLVGNLLSPLANLIFTLGMTNWRAVRELPGWMKSICAASFAISIVQMGARAVCSARIYGWRFAAGVPLRVLWANVVNAVATVGAISQFATACCRNSRLMWRKTDHVYPVDAAARIGQERFGQFLVRLGLVSPSEIDDALTSQPRGTPLGEYLVQLQKLSEEHLYFALSLHAGLELGVPEPDQWTLGATRKLPIASILRWKVVPYRIDLGQLHLLTPNLPTQEMTRDLARYCSLGLRFRLIEPAEFDRQLETVYGSRFTALRLTA